MVSCSSRRAIGIQDTYLPAHISDRLLDSNHIQRLGIANNRSDQSLLGRNSNADIDVVPVDNGITAILTLDGSVDSGQIAHGQHTGTSEGAHETELHTGLLENVILVELPELHQGRHIDLVEGSEGGSRVLGLL